MQFSKWVKDISLTPASSSTRENQPYLNDNGIHQLPIVTISANSPYTEKLLYLNRKTEGLLTETKTSATATVSLVVHL
jgi:hypothetical protein